MESMQPTRASPGTCLCALTRLSAAVFLWFTSLACHADIHTFNEAVKRGDYRSAANQTVEIWRTFDKQSPQTATVAREFGFIDYLAGQYKDARVFATFLVRYGAKLAIPDDEPSTSRALLAAVDFRLSPGRRERDQLYDALERRKAAPGIDNITVIAADLAYGYDWKRAAWQEAQQSASLAADLFARGGTPLLVQARRARMTTIAAAFFVKKRPDEYQAMVALHNQLVSDIDAHPNNPQMATLQSLHWQAMAWAYAMQSWFRSYYRQLGSHVNLDIKRRKLKKTAAELNRPRRHYSKPLCTGHIYHKSLHFPLGPAFKGMVGSVILRAAFNVRGYLVNPRILASAPSTQFNKEVLEDSKHFRWEADKGIDTRHCRLESDDVVIPIEFLID